MRDLENEPETETMGAVSPEDHERVTKAIRAVEEETSGEVYAVVAQTSDDYFYVAGFVAACWSIAFALVIALAKVWFEFEFSTLQLVLALVASLGGSLWVLHLFPHLRMVFVPQRIGYRRASNNAKRQFLAHGIHGTKHRSGILLFVSLAEHYAEVVADAGINEKVEQEDWDEIVGQLTAYAAKDELGNGFVKAIEMSGALLIKHFPPESEPHNDLDDRLVEI